MYMTRRLRKLVLLSAPIWFLSATLSRDLNTELLKSVKAGDLNLVQSFLSQGADANSKDANNNTALMSAAEKGSLEIVKLLLEKGADVNRKNANDSTALILAAGAGQLEIVKILLEKGSDQYSEDVWGLTPLLNAVVNGYAETVKFLLEPRGSAAQPSENSSGSTEKKSKLHRLILLSDRKFIEKTSVGDLFSLRISAINKGVGAGFDVARAKSGEINAAPRGTTGENSASGLAGVQLYKNFSIDEFIQKYGEADQVIQRDYTEPGPPQKIVPVTAYIYDGLELLIPRENGKNKVKWICIPL